MLTLILIKKIISLFIMLLLGVVLVKTKILKPADSKVISAVAVYLASPCAILTAFEVDVTPEVISGLGLALVSALVIHVLILALLIPGRKLLKLDAVDQISILYSNAGNLIFPLVTAMLGAEWVIYSCAYIAVQRCFLWSHGLATLQEDAKPDIKKILLNINMLSVFIGIAIFLTGFRFPDVIEDSMVSFGNMLGPLCMLVTGMLIGGQSFKKILANKRVWMATALRLIVVPVIILVVMKLTGGEGLIEIGSTVLLISYMATLGPSASTVTQMAVLYDRDADYASAINVLTTLGCILTMPLFVYLYQLF